MCSSFGLRRANLPRLSDGRIHFDSDTAPTLLLDTASRHLAPLACGGPEAEVGRGIPQRAQQRRHAGTQELLVLDVQNNIRTWIDHVAPLLSIPPSGSAATTT